MSADLRAPAPEMRPGPPPAVAEPGRGRRQRSLAAETLDALRLVVAVVTLPFRLVVWIAETIVVFAAAAVIIAVGLWLGGMVSDVQVSDATVALVGRFSSLASLVAGKLGFCAPAGRGPRRVAVPLTVADSVPARNSRILPPDGGATAVAIPFPIA